MSVKADIINITRESGRNAHITKNCNPTKTITATQSNPVKINNNLIKAPTILIIIFTSFVER